VSSRAVLRPIEAGYSAVCPSCDEPVKFKAKERAKARQIIANVYEDGTWDRVEHWHAHCYEESGRPYGPPQVTEPLRSPTGRRKAANVDV
jgi:hypothetical protein